MVRFLCRVVGLVALFVLLAQCAAADDYIFEPGLSLRQPQLQVKGDKGSGSSMGKLTSHRTLFPSLAISTPNRYFDESDHWGYAYFGDIAFSKIDRQTQIGPPAANGQPAYQPGAFSPVRTWQLDAGVDLFLTFGDKLVKNPAQGSQFRMGVGVGLSIASLKGTVPGQYMQSGIPENINATGAGVSGNVFFRYTLNGWFIDASVYTASLTRGLRNYSVSDSSVTLGYSIPFSL
jgi:hypothetical protein